VGKLLEGVHGLATELPEWQVIGVLACRASSSDLARFSARTDVRVWGREDLAAISQAESPEAIGRLLWLPPGTPAERS
jgi:hypothetical protein